MAHGRAECGGKMAPAGDDTRPAGGILEANEQGAAAERPEGKKLQSGATRP